MRIINRSHQQIKQETLSEYLDGRIQGSALARVEEQLAECHVCHSDMESLRSAMTILRELPEEAPRRSFIMAAPPPMPTRPPNSAFQLPSFLRVPQWAYAGAASVAVIVFVALISADATGLLSTDGVSQLQVQSTGATQKDESVAAAPQAVQGASPAATAAPAAASTEPAPVQSLAVAPAQESAGQDSTLAATADQAAPPVALAAEASQERTAAAAAVGATGAQGESGVASGDGFAENQAEPIAPPEIKKLPATSPVPTEVLLPESEGTALVWRVLEGLAAVLGLIFLVALGFKWRSSRNIEVG